MTRLGALHLDLARYADLANDPTIGEIARQLMTEVQQTGHSPTLSALLQTIAERCPGLHGEVIAIARELADGLHGGSWAEGIDMDMDMDGSDVSEHDSEPTDAAVCCLAEVLAEARADDAEIQEEDREAAEQDVKREAEQRANSASDSEPDEAEEAQGDEETDSEDDSDADGWSMMLADKVAEFHAAWRLQTTSEGACEQSNSDEDSSAHLAALIGSVAGRNLDARTTWETIDARLDIMEARLETSPDETKELTALAEIREEQNKTDLCLPPAAFELLVREIGQDFRSYLAWTPDAIAALQTAAEDHLISLFSDAGHAAIHGHRTHIQLKDVQAARRTQDKCFVLARDGRDEWNEQDEQDEWDEQS